MLAYTNASTIITDQYRDAEDLGGIFAGFDAETRSYEDDTRCGNMPGTKIAAGRPRPATMKWRIVQRALRIISKIPRRKRTQLCAIRTA